MEPIKEIEQLEGKTIKKAAYVSWGEAVIIIFKDDTYAFFKPERDYDGDCEVYLSHKLSDYEKMEAGIISREEYDNIKKEEERLRKSQQAKRERILFEELKAKYES